jgi:hypothetical protein
MCSYPHPCPSPLEGEGGSISGSIACRNRRGSGNYLMSVVCAPPAMV